MSDAQNQSGANNTHPNFIGVPMLVVLGDCLQWCQHPWIQHAINFRQWWILMVSVFCHPKFQSISAVDFLTSFYKHCLGVQLNMCASRVNVWRKGIWNDCTKKTQIHITVYTKQSTFWAKCESHTWTLKMLLTKMRWSAGRNRWIWYFPRNIATSITATAATTAAAT